METLEPLYWRLPERTAAIRQGELLSHVERDEIAVESIGRPDDVTFLTTVSAYALVMSQDCDIEYDKGAREILANEGPAPLRGEDKAQWDQRHQGAALKRMDCILLCVAQPADEVRGSGMNTEVWRNARSNQNERYHFLRPVLPEADLDGQGLPQLVLDFKRYFALRPVELERRCELGGAIAGGSGRRSVLCGPFLHDVVSRFFHYQARVALPPEYRAQAGQRSD